MAEDNLSWLSIGQAAKHLGVSRDTLRRWEKAGRLQARRSPTNRRYYTKQILDEALSHKPAPAQIPKAAPVQTKKSAKISLSRRQKLVVIGVLSFLFAVTIALCIQIFFFG